MSQVDLSVFEEMNEIMSTDYSYSGRYDLNTFVYALCEGEVFVSDEESKLFALIKAIENGMILRINQIGYLLGCW